MRSACLLLVILLLSTKLRAAEPIGVYADDQLRIELYSDDGENVSGNIYRGELKLPFTARASDRELVGTFQSDGEKFEFRATPGEGDTLVLETGGKRYNLKHEAQRAAAATANPLAGATHGEPSVQPQRAPIGAASSPQRGDPLAYRVLDLPGGSVAKFDNWTYLPIQGQAGVMWCDCFPQGRQTDFVLRTCIGTPSAKDMANLFTVGPQLTQQVLAQFFGPVFKREGQPKQTKCGGDDAMIEDYRGAVNGQQVTCRVMYVKRKDVAVAVLGIGNEKGFNEFGRAIEIVAQSITLKESQVEPGLVGTWTAENYVSTGSSGARNDVSINLAQQRSITIYPNGTFSDSATSGFSGENFTGLAEGGHRGTVVKRGNVLTFHYDNGNTWSPAYELYSNGLKIDGVVYLKQ